jgi:hypothetical protein
MKTTVIRKELNNMKLTIAKEEMRIKIKTDLPKEQEERVVKFCEYVYSKLTPEQMVNTLRGDILMIEGKYLMTRLWNNQRKYKTDHFCEKEYIN